MAATVFDSGSYRAVSRCDECGKERECLIAWMEVFNPVFQREEEVVVSRCDDCSEVCGRPDVELFDNDEE